MAEYARIAVSACCAVSSAARIAPTWPSIIPLGATTSAPAIGLRDRDRAVTLERRVVVHLTRSRQQPTVTVVGVLVEAGVGHEHDGVADVVAQVPQRDLHDAVGRIGLAPACVLDLRGCRTGSRRVPRGRRARGPPCGGSPGCAAPPRASRRPARGSSMPSFTKSGATRSSTPSRVSATSRRIAGVRRSRRGRCSGKVTGSGYRPGAVAERGEQSDHQAVDRVRVGFGIDAQARADARSRSSPDRSTRRVGAGPARTDQSRRSWSTVDDDVNVTRVDTAAADPLEIRRGRALAVTVR